MAALQQRESVLLPDDAENHLNTITITADDLRAAQRELERRQAEAYPETGTETGRGGASCRRPARAPAAARHWTRRHRATELLLCMGAEYEAVLDVATLRTLRAATGLHYRRVLNATLLQAGGSDQY